jgi:hypothetical protein
MSYIPITTNAMARTQGQHQERARCSLAIHSQIGQLHERISETQSVYMKQVWAIAILELQELARIIERPVKEMA